jgi:hypothetical protein
LFKFKVILKLIQFLNSLLSTINGAEIGIKKRIKIKNQNCLCQNDGTCVLQNDLCVCKKQFTGRFCEIDLSIDQELSRSYSCGRLEHQYSEFKKCSKCTCRYNLLKCVPHWNSECGTTISKLKFKKIKNKSLNMIKKYSNAFSNNSYLEYIKIVNEVYFMNEFNFTNLNDKNFDFLGESSLNLQKIIVITSNLNDENMIKGIYYLNSKNCGRTYFDKFYILLLLSFLNFYKFL